ncbi:Receptor-type guanylate cyclase gcy [Seminavis robusta]|uniref:Receptor-type guanylate cyclase gcy n=1 Tax=Seminavis robusta TaxID=568900 RepID=A0A9N8DXZ2_9STRA|nr:Receptor-type guanylate cyclase gcy [Seminavis robusta]|eukprot:Sro330_g118880.1 Receptor-type guanylate cyclase gcy (2547) ;mRNA; f:14784-23938
MLRVENPALASYCTIIHPRDSTSTMASRSMTGRAHLSLLVKLVFVLGLLGTKFVGASIEKEVQVSYVLEPFESKKNATEGEDYEPGSDEHLILQTTNNPKVSWTNDALFGKRAINIEVPTVSQSGVTWLVDDENSPYNCMGASYLSFWYKLPKAQPELSITLTVWDSSKCDSNCTKFDNLEAYPIGPLVLEHFDAESWQEIRVDLPILDMRLDRIKGWGFSFDNEAGANAASPLDDKSAVIVDHVACVGGGDLVSAAFKFGKQEEQETFQDSVSSNVWVPEYYKSDTSENETRVQLEDGKLSMDYVVQMSEDWGGFLSYRHLAPANSYYNLSQATQLTLDYMVQQPCSAPGRAHLRLIIYDGQDCPSFCSDSNKNLEGFYAFEHVLDDLAQTSFSVELEGTDDSSSPFWLTGWVGSVHNSVLDPGNVKGFTLEINIDSQGMLGSLASGHVAVGELVASNNPIGLQSGDIQVSYVLEPFESKVENVTGQPYQPAEGEHLIFATTDDPKLDVTWTDEASFGDWGINIQLSPSASSNVEGPRITWIVDDENPAYNCRGATYLSLWYKVPVEQHGLEFTLILLDEAACTVNCTDPENLQPILVGPFNPVSSQDWKELRVNLPIHDLHMDQIRGWGLSFQHREAQDFGQTEGSSVHIDHVACVGGGDLVSAPWSFGAPGQDNYEEGYSKQVWRSTYYESPTSENETQVELIDEMLSINYVVEQTEDWGGFLSFGHLAPANSYYNLSQATELSLDYMVQQPFSMPGRSHLRLIVYDGHDCPANCSDSSKNTEAYYSFSYVLDDIAQTSFSVDLEGTDDSSSPFWLTGWVGSVHNSFLDRAYMKGFSLEINIDSQGIVGSLGSGMLVVGRMMASNNQAAFLSDDVQVSYVLEPFESKIENVTGQPYQPAEGEHLIFATTESPSVDVSWTDEAIFGEKSISITLAPNATSAHAVTTATWIVDDENPAYNCRGATYLSLWYKVPDEQKGLEFTLVLFDEAACTVNCTDPENLQPVLVGPFNPVSSQGWKELRVNLPIHDLHMDQIRGWGLSFQHMETQDVGQTESSTVYIDHLACVGGGDLVSAPWNFGAPGQDNFEDGLSKQAWRSTYYNSPTSENETQVELIDGMLSIDYVAEQTEDWGGFLSFGHLAPANSYYNLSQATQLTLDYMVQEPSSSPGRAHLRLIVYDGHDCPGNCSDSSKNTEAYYSFSYLLDDVAESSFSVELEGTDDSSSPFWLTGWVGSVHNSVLDRAYMKGFSLEINVDSQGTVGSFVSGTLMVGRMVASSGKQEQVGLKTTDITVEEGLLFRNDGGSFQMVEFIDREQCQELCLGDSRCVYAFADRRDCYMASYLEETDVDISTTAQEEDTYTSFWVNTAGRRGEFCDLCECHAEDRVIDCNGRDLAVVPKSFSPPPRDGQDAWMPRIIDLSGNPRLLVIGAGSFDDISDYLEEIVLPEGLLYLSSSAVKNFTVLESIVVGDRLKNVVDHTSGFFADVCCGLGDQGSELTFCDMQVDHPGRDSLYFDFVQYVGGNIQKLEPSSEFGSEGAESAEKCAEFCALHKDCHYFAFDQRYQEAEHTCFLLDDMESSNHICCDGINDYADLDRTIPGWTSGVAPRTRSKKRDAVVLVTPTSLKAEQANDYRVEFRLALGSKPLRGAVWIEPTIESSTDLDYTLSPTRIALYDNSSVATVAIHIRNPEIIKGVGETLVVSNKLESCDSAFTALDTEASNVYVQVLVPQEAENDLSLVVGVSIAVLVIVVGLAVYVVVDRRRLARYAKKELEDSERDEVEEVRKTIRKDSIRIDIAKGAMLVTLVTAGIGMTVWGVGIQLDDASMDLQEQQPDLVSEVEESSSTSASAFPYVLAVVFAFILIGFMVYDWLVRIRNRKLVLNAAKSGEIMTTMFPDQIRKKLLEDTKTNKKASREKGKEGQADEGHALADLYPSTTICFMDVQGFTAWASSRQPHQVFQLLEAVFGAFDTIAKANKVYKVETIGDSYVCITGAPDFQEDHAERMCRFASRCTKKFRSLSRKLVASLGPDTGELNIRAGVHSGQVVMGVLRGSRARYQLFGDTVNLAARMESTCEAGMVQISLETAEILRDKVMSAAGKGRMLDETSSMGTTDLSKASHDLDEQGAKLSNLISWNTEQLLFLIKKIVACRQGSQTNAVTDRPNDTFSLKDDRTYLGEVAEIIELPQSRGVDFEAINVQDVEIDNTVVKELRLLVSNIASLYNDNPFHNFEHASHVTLSIIKLLSRIVKPSERELATSDLSLHDHSYGITSDPLTHFAVAFCGLIHDADHPGVPNTQMIKEDPILGARFEERSVAEQNSLRQCFDLLSRDDYSNLRDVLFNSNEDQDRFRQLVVNSVMATDICDKDLKSLRNNRWDTAFSEEKKNEPRDMTVNRKATIVIEHLIQASDVSHTMQHWNVYRKWNEKLLQEMYQAYKESRAANDPTIGWAKGEIGFFDFYIIPLAKKLKECGVFGVSSDEYLNYALINRRKWEVEGAAITAEMVARLKQQDLVEEQAPLPPPKNLTFELDGIDEVEELEEDEDEKESCDLSV